MKKFRTKSLNVAAIRFLQENLEEIRDIPGVKVYVTGPFYAGEPPGNILWAEAHNLDDAGRAQPGDWILVTEEGRVFFATNEDFQKTFEPAGWTQEKPAQSGYYWATTESVIVSEEPEIVWYSADSGVILRVSKSEDTGLVSDDWDVFCGPIECPGVPE